MTVTAAILCGGKGSRLAPVLGDMPKCLAPVWGVPFVMNLLNYLGDQGVGKIVLCTGHGAGQVEEIIGEHYEVQFSRDDIGGTVSAVRTARDLGLLETDPVLVVNGDTWCPFQLAPLLKWHRAKKAGQTRLFGHPLYSDKAYTDCQVHTGVRLLSQEYLKHLPENIKDLDEWYWFTEYCCTGVSFLDIGTPEGYAVAEDVING